MWSAKFYAAPFPFWHKYSRPWHLAITQRRRQQQLSPADENEFVFSGFPKYQSLKVPRSEIRDPDILCWPDPLIMEPNRLTFIGCRIVSCTQIMMVIPIRSAPNWPNCSTQHACVLLQMATSWPSKWSDQNIKGSPNHNHLLWSTIAEKLVAQQIL